MRQRRVACGLLAILSVLGLVGCGGQGDTSATSTTTTPQSTTSLPSPAKPSTPTNTTAAVKAKIMADYRLSIATQSRGIVSNSPSFPYGQVLTGNALSTLKSTMTGAYVAGTKYSGGFRFVKGEVIAMNLKAKPATATVQSCVFDALKATSKSGAVQSSSTKVSREDELVLVGSRWKITESESFDKTEPGCA